VGGRTEGMRASKGVCPSPYGRFTCLGDKFKAISFGEDGSVVVQVRAERVRLRGRVTCLHERTYGLLTERATPEYRHAGLQQVRSRLAREEFRERATRHAMADWPVAPTALDAGDSSSSSYPVSIALKWVVGDGPRLAR